MKKVKRTMSVTDVRIEETPEGKLVTEDWRLDTDLQEAFRKVCIVKCSRPLARGSDFQSA